VKEETYRETNEKNPIDTIEKELVRQNRIIQQQNEELLTLNKTLTIKSRLLEVLNRQMNKRDANLRKKEEDLLEKNRLIEKQIIQIDQQNKEQQKVNEMLVQKNIALNFFSQKIIESEYKFRMLFDNLSDPVVIHDLKGNFLEVNQEACNVLKYSKDQLLCMNISDINPGISRIKEAINKVEQEKEALFETENIDSNGLVFPVEVNSRLIRFKDIPAIISIARDITEQKKIREELIQSRKKAEEADRLKSAFLANMSHEIRTPLNAIIGFSDLMTSRAITGDQQDIFLDHIRNSGYQLLNIINDIIDLAKIEAGQLQINKEEVFPDNLLQDLLSHYEGLLHENKSVSIKLETPSENKIEKIMTDNTRVRQIFNNLLGNAIKFTDEGIITFGYRLDNEKKDSQHSGNSSVNLLFFVRDTGIGIQQEDQEKVFDRFKQVNDSYTRNREGTGLGLTISRNLARMMGGDIWVESAYGHGTTFYFSLAVDNNNTSDKQATLKISDKMTIDAYNWKNKTILIAEDEEINFLFLEELVSESEPEILHACDGAEAVDIALKTPKIDLVLMDIKMPVLSGIDAAIKIRNEKKQIPIIAQTAYAMQDDRKKYTESGLFDEYLSKPISKESLFAVMQKFLNVE
jgi:PAS domain S-box-containing protein